MTRIIALIRRFARWLLWVTEPRPSFLTLGLERYVPEGVTGDVVRVSPFAPSFAVLATQAYTPIETEPTRNVLHIVADDAEEREAVKRAYADMGFPIDEMADDFDVKRTGHTHALVHRASLILGRPDPIATFGDIVALLKAQRPAFAPLASRGSHEQADSENEDRGVETSLDAPGPAEVPRGV